MDRKNIPLLFMLTAGAVTAIITFVRELPLVERMVWLFSVMLLFFVLGSVIKWTLDFFDNQNEQRRLKDGEVIEKEAEGQEDVQKAAEDEEPAPENTGKQTV